MNSTVSSSRTFLVVFVAALILGVHAEAATEKVLYAFNIADGEYPYNGVVFDNAGNLYGTTFYGGGHYCNGSGCGIVFKLTPGGDGTWTERAIYTFTGGMDGSHPYSHLLFDAAGNLYGTTFGNYAGGGTGFGTAYRLSPQTDGSWKFSLLHTFTGGKDGAQPSGPMAFDQAGNLYGASFTGGNDNLGTVFQLSPASGARWKETVLHSFTGGEDGSYPADGVLAANGKVYGTTEQGGTGCGQLGCGVVFELAPTGSGGWKEILLHRFVDGPDGEGALGLVFDSSGDLYGAAGGGNKNYCGGGCGLVFRLSPLSDGTWQDTVLHNFNGDNGEGPETLSFDTNGRVFGVAGGGGLGAGLIFELNPNENWAETVIYQFSGGGDGGDPLRPLALDTTGNLYGTAVHGGAGNVGVVFEIVP
jgi:uncharacterized repeat protein (TIGR03803 family)